MIENVNIIINNIKSDLEHMSVQQQLLLLVNSMVATFEQFVFIQSRAAAAVYADGVKMTHWQKRSLVSKNVNSNLGSCLAGSHVTEKDNEGRRTHLTASVQRSCQLQASFNLRVWTTA